MGQKAGSIDVDELVKAIEALEACDLDIPDEDAETITTVKELFSYFEANNHKKQ